MISKEEKDKIDFICNEYGIKKYSINSNGSIDVNGDVYLSYREIFKLPLKFNNVIGNFRCNSNKLTSLDGAPVTVGGYFYCSHNQLTSLVGGPVTVGGDFDCDNNHLTTLVGSPISVGGDFNCDFNILTTLVDSPITISGHFNCNNNCLTSLMGAPTMVGGSFQCIRNKLINLIGAPSTVGVFSSGGNYLTSTYSGDTDIEVSGALLGDGKLLPQLYRDNISHIKLILKYQRHFEIWNADLTLNEENFQVLLDEINDGLK